MNPEDEEAVEAYLKNQISFNELVEKIGEEDAETIQASKQMLKEGVELAEALVEK
jgi:1-deoxy-D-xylulose 5-phosphate reductoisomerase